MAVEDVCPSPKNSHDNLYMQQMLDDICTSPKKFRG